MQGSKKKQKKRKKKMVLINKNDLGFITVIHNMFINLGNYSNLFIYKVFFILFLFALHLWFINSGGDPALSNENKCKESMIGSLNRFIKEHGNSIMGLGTLYTVYLGLVTARLNKEIADTTLENKKALEKAIEDNRQLSADNDNFFNEMRNYKYK